MKRTFWFAAIALAIFLTMGIYRAGQHELPPPNESQNVVFNHGAASGHRLKTKSWTASYDRIVANADQTVLDLENVHDGVIYRKAKPYLSVRAKQLSVNTLSHNFSASGALHVETIGRKPARSFDTTEATWTDATQELDMPDRVVIRTGAQAPLNVGSLTLDVRTGDLTLHQISGSVRFK
jgi:hypothetical protein